MEYLLDTNALINILYQNKRLSAEFNKAYSNKNNHFFVSDASLWEIEIKHNKYPDLMPFSASQVFELLIDTEISFLPIHLSHIASLEEVYKLNIHKDPFDALLIATAYDESMILITSDKKILEYSIISKLKI